MGRVFALVLTRGRESANTNNGKSVGRELDFLAVAVVSNNNGSSNDWASRHEAAQSHSVTRRTIQFSLVHGLRQIPLASPMIILFISRLVSVRAVTACVICLGRDA